jgi:uncharacterized protein YraI
VLGVIAFIAVVVALFVVVVASTASDDPPRRVAGAGRSTTTTTTLPPAGPYRVTDGVNIRAGPGSTYPALGLIETGNEVLVTCVIDGEQVSGPLGLTTKWVRIVTPYGPAYLTAQYVATGPDIGSPTIIPVCNSV